MPSHRWTAPADVNPRLDAFLAKMLPRASKADVQRWLAAGLVKVNGKKAKPLRRLFGGEEIELSLPDAAPSREHDASLPRLRVLHETSGWVIVDKPAGLVVEREGTRPSVVAAAAQQLEGWNLAGRAEPGVVHRLDKDTTGCLLLARTDEAMRALLLGFEQKQIHKTYLALVAGTPPDTGKLDTPYGRNPDDPRRYTTRVSSARRARLSWRKQRQLDGFALLEIDLDTGRTHQIRAQLADVGHPLLGDWLYGTAEARALGRGRIALHAWKLQLEGLTVEAPVPDDLA